jgi:hypothetical protein
MSKKLYAAFLPLFAVAAFAVMPAVAQAQPHWYSNGVRIKLSTPVTVTTKGTLVLHAFGLTITCTVKDKGTIENPDNGTAGVDSITEFVNSACKSSNETEPPPKGCPAPEIGALGLPWKTLLLPGPPIRDEITGIKIEVKCSGAKVDEFFGTLTPKIVNGSPVTTCKEATDSFAEFDTPGSGFLSDAATPPNKATVTGNDFIEGPAGDRCITVKNP